VQSPRRILLCSGKIGHNLRVEREKRQKAGQDANVAIVFLDQLYPWPEQEVQAALDQHPQAEVVWVQEEPANMGARFYVMPHLRRMSRDRVVVNVTLGQRQPGDRIGQSARPGRARADRYGLRRLR
jgi:2-oxoglutarate dehydrogenase E1 component